MVKGLEKVSVLVGRALEVINDLDNKRDEVLDAADVLLAKASRVTSVVLDNAEAFLYNLQSEVEKQTGNDEADSPYDNVRPKDEPLKEERFLNDRERKLADIRQRLRNSGVEGYQSSHWFDDKVTDTYPDNIINLMDRVTAGLSN